LFRKRLLPAICFLIFLSLVLVAAGCSDAGPGPGPAPSGGQAPVVEPGEEAALETEGSPSEAVGQEDTDQGLAPPAGDSETAAGTGQEEGAPGEAAGLVKAHFIDVGQGDACLVELPGGQTILIDGGSRAAGEKLLSYLREQGVERIDYLIATHPHEDHIGGLIGVVERMEIGKIYMPRVAHTTRTYEQFLEAIQAKGLKITAARAGVTVDTGEGVEAVFVAPCREDYKELNDHSAVLKLTYGQVSFLFTGDAEAEAEQDMLAGGADLAAQVLKAGHHGSSTSSSEAFLRAVQPQIAVISAGKDNSYGHPHREVLERLTSLGVEILRTDLAGDIVITADRQGIVAVATAVQ